MLKKKLAVQMYTLRDFTKSAADFAASLRQISDMGYTAVQLSAVGAMNGAPPAVSAAEARKMLDDCGLTCIATHRGLDALLHQTDAEIEFHRTLGCDFAAIGGIGKPYEDTPAGYRQFIKDTKAMIAKLKAAGIRFGHHNHDREFTRCGFRGPWLEDVLIDEGGPDLMLELDLYWIEHAGANCVRILERSAGRVPVIHLKDKEVVPGLGPVMAPIGEGNLDWKSIVPACEAAGVKWYAIEQDTCRRDPFDCLKSSYDFLASF